MTIGGSGNGTLEISNGGRVQNASGRIGRANGSAGTVTVAGAGSNWTMTGRLSIGGDSSTDTNGGTGSLRIQTGAKVSVAQDTVLFPDGMLRLEGGTFSSTDISFQGGGTFAWTAGTLHAGIFRGSLVVPSGGILAPGNSAGSTEVRVDYSQMSGGILQIELGGLAPTQFDRVTVVGDAVLGGDLQLALLDGILPNPESTFTIFDARGISGAFANVADGQRLMTTDGVGSFLVNYGAGSPFDPKQIVLSSFVVATLPGDYNQNGTVDAADYVVWRKNLGSGTSLPNDDTPGVGPDDYSWWRTNFGRMTGLGSSASGATVPEPTTLVLLISLCLVCRPARLSDAGSQLQWRDH